MRTVTFEELAQIAIDSKDDLWNAASSVARTSKIYLHWSAGHYGQAFDGYHINIDQDGSIYLSTDNLAKVLSHTWRNNTGNIGVSMLCCAFAEPNDLGNEPPTELQIESMSKVIAILCKYLEIPCNEEHVKTHAEQAMEDGYFGERWDLLILHTGDEIWSGGSILRGKANWYMNYGNI